MGRWVSFGERFLMTRLTWTKTSIEPTEMWVDARTARDYEALGFVMEDFKPSPKGMVGLDAGRVKIRKPGPKHTHVWSPELAALHKFITTAYGHAHKELHWGNVWKRLGDAHNLLFNKYHYHDLMFVEQFSNESLEPVQARVVAAIKDIASNEKGDAARRIRCWANEVEAWNYTQNCRSGS